MGSYSCSSPLLFLVLLLSLSLVQMKPIKRGIVKRSAEDCGGMSVDNENLGLGYSAATGDPAYSSECFPHGNVGFPGGYPNHGYDDSVAVFVGGDFICEVGAEVEANVVVLGDLIVQSGGPSNFGAVGAGTQVIPNNGGNCIVVGGDLEAYREIQVFNLYGTMECDIVYRGSSVNVGNWKTNGDVRNEPSFDMSQYDRIAEIFANKSAYWGTFPANGVVNELYTTTTFTCTDSDEVQVFEIQGGDDEITVATSYKFTASCEDKTILINVKGSGTILVDAVDFYDYKGAAGGSFDTCFGASIIWNFPDAADVEVGNGHFSEFYGALLVTGNLKFTTTGHSGRTIALGNLVHNRAGSEFHNMHFKPPVDLPCYCVDEYCPYVEGRCNPHCEDNQCVTDECVPTTVDCAEIITTNVTLPATVTYESCAMDVMLILREDRNTVLIDNNDYGCEMNVETCESGIYLGCVGSGDEVGMFITSTTDGDVMDLTGSYIHNSCCAPGTPATTRNDPPNRVCDFYT